MGYFFTVFVYIRGGGRRPCVQHERRVSPLSQRRADDALRHRRRCLATRDDVTPGDVIAASRDPARLRARRPTVSPGGVVTRCLAATSCEHSIADYICRAVDCKAVTLFRSSPCGDTSV